MSRRQGRKTVATRRSQAGADTGRTSTPRLIFAVVAGVLLVAAGLGWGVTGRDRLRARAEAASRSERWEDARVLWHEYNLSRHSGAPERLAEAKSALAVGHAAQALEALEAACSIRPDEPEAWVIRLEILRVQDRTLEAAALGREALAKAGSAHRREILRAATVAVLADTPEGIARRTLKRWSEADAQDVESRVALLRRIAAAPRPDDPPRADRVRVLSGLLKAHPRSVTIREALVTEFADGGDPENGRPLLRDWPNDLKDARYDRLAGRWALDFDGRPAEAVAHLRKTVAALPHDWRIRYRLARALGSAGLREEATAEAEQVTRLRDLLDPDRLGKRLDADLASLDRAASRADLADLCRRLGLDRLAEAWESEAKERDPFGDMVR